MKKNYLLSLLTVVGVSIGCEQAFSKTSPALANGLSNLTDKSASVLAVDFTVDDTLTCSGIVQFTDLSANGATAWLWNFGDGGASTVQNPSYTYTTPGYFTVRLITLGIAGVDSVVKTDYVHVEFLTPPVVSADTTLCQYNPAILTAVGAVGNIAWYDMPTGGTLLATGDTFTTQAVTATTTYYASSQLTSSTTFGGAPDSAIGPGMYYTANQNRYLIFDCLTQCRLVSVLVYANGAGTRDIVLASNNGTVIQSASVNLPDGPSRVYLNFDLQPGNNLRLGNPGGSDLFRNSGGANYPMDINGQVSITGNNGANGYYYFFYDWEISNPPCLSPRVPVTVTVTPGPQASFVTSQNLNIINVLELSLGATSWSWDFGDGSAIDTLQNPPVHIYTAAGTYSITLTVSNGTCSSSLVIPITVTTAAGINQLNAANVTVMPNPVKDNLQISFSGLNEKATISVSNTLGQVVYIAKADEVKSNVAVLNVSNLKSGIYILKIESNEGVLLKKIIKE